MSETVKHKLYDYELAPPPEAWEKIILELNEWTALLPYRDKLSRYSLAAPPAAWNRIAEVLDKKPAGSLSEKLLTAEVPPPMGTWDQIRSGLEEYKPKKRRIPVFVRYAAAAVLTGLVVWSVLLLTNGKTSHDEATVSGPGSPGKDATVSLIAPPVTEHILTNDADEARNDAALEESKRSYARLDRKRASYSPLVKASMPYEEPGTEEIYDTGYDSGSSVPDISDRYIVLMTPEGNFIRMSKKLSDLACCVSGEEQDKECKEQVERWRKQLACSSATHPGNFGDILSLLSSLQEN